LTRDVGKARQRAVEYLIKSAQHGQWETPKHWVGGLADMRGGLDGLAAYALLEAGAPPGNSPVSDALARFAKAEPKRTYPVALQTLALVKADPKKYAAQIQANANWLLKTAVRSEGRLAGWSYPFGKESRADGSNTQYALHALSAAAGAGAKVDPKLWAEVRELYVRTKRPGGWSYTSGSVAPPSQTMTAAALCGLYAADRHIGKPDQRARAALAEGLADWAKTYPRPPVDWAKLGPQSKSAFYQWYGTARLGRLAGKKLAPPAGPAIDWYRDGATWLVKNQKPDGSWALPSGTQVDKDPIVGTSFGLLFLGGAKK
jgi:hypothetical protein